MQEKAAQYTRQPEDFTYSIYILPKAYPTMKADSRCRVAHQPVLLSDTKSSDQLTNTVIALGILLIIQKSCPVFPLIQGIKICSDPCFRSKSILSFVVTPKIRVA